MVDFNGNGNGNGQCGHGDRGLGTNGHGTNGHGTNSFGTNGQEAQGVNTSETSNSMVNTSNFDSQKVSLGQQHGRPVSSPQIMLTSFDPNDMQEVTDLFSRIRQNRIDLTCSQDAKLKKSIYITQRKVTEQDNQLAKEFDGYLWTVMDSLSQ